MPKLISSSALSSLILLQLWFAHLTAFHQQITGGTQWKMKIMQLRSSQTPALETPDIVPTRSPTIFQSANSVDSLKMQILQMGAALDRGQSYNPTSGEYYGDRMKLAKAKVHSLIEQAKSLPSSLADMDGEWELVFSTVPHGIFRSSPFFLAIQEAYSLSFQSEKANLFFKLHELQTCSWGASKIGKVAQIIDSKNGVLISEFDTSLFSMTVIPILGWFKLLPTFGGTVITVSNANLVGDTINMEVDYTTSRPVQGLAGLGEFVFGKKVPVGAIWELLPWNKGRKPTCSVKVKYADNDFRIVEDLDGELFVYTRPVKA